MGVDLPNEKRIEIALTYIYGIGRCSANKILKLANIDLNTRAKDLLEEEVSRITGIIQRSYMIEGELRQSISENIKRLIEINSWRGIRHTKNLPVRGQRTRTNARMRKGPKKTVGSGAKRIAKPAGPSAEKSSSKS
jgi:small subunit ribosomal protein S13